MANANETASKTESLSIMLTGTVIKIAVIGYFSIVSIMPQSSFLNGFSGIR